MSVSEVPFEKIKEEFIKDEEFCKEYERIKPRYDAIKQILEARHDQNITQEELAKRMGTKKSNISRFESGNYNPSLDFLIRIAEALGKKVYLQIK